MVVLGVPAPAPSPSGSGGWVAAVLGGLWGSLLLLQLHLVGWMVGGDDWWLMVGGGHRGSKGILLFFQKTRMLQSKGVVTLFHLLTYAIYGRNCFDMQH